MMPDFGYAGEKYETPIEFRLPQLTGQQLLQLGLSADEWKERWIMFTDDERNQFMEDMQ